MNNVIVYRNELGDSVEFSTKSGIFLTSFPLLSGLNVSVNTSQSIDQIGGVVDSQVVEPKTSTVKGFIRGNGVEGKKRLLRVFRPLGKGTFTVNNEYSMGVLVSETPTVERAIQFPRFDIGITASYPFWERVNSTMTLVAGTVGKFRFPWYIPGPYSFGWLVKSYFSTIKNDGQIPTYYDLQISASGAAKNPVFTDVATGNFLKLNKSFSTGERVTISIRPESVTAISSVDGNIQGLIDIDSTLFSFSPGDTVMRYDTEEGKESLNITLTLSGKFAGIVI